MRKQYFLLAAFILASLSVLTFAQLGEEAGQPFLNVSVGGSATFNYSILNSGSAPIPFTVVLPTLNTIPNNATPTIKVTPMNGTLAPHSSQVISITAYVPYGDKPHLKWQGVLSVIESAPVSNVTNGAGAVVMAGVAKIVTIESEPPKSSPLLYYIAAFIVLVVVIVVAYLALFGRNKSRKENANAAAASHAGNTAANKIASKRVKKKGKGNRNSRGSNKRSSKKTQRKKNATRKRAAKK